MKYLKMHTLFGALTILFFSNESFPQAGVLDPTFGQGGIVTTAINVISTGDNTANSVGIQSDGKIVAAGVTHYRGDHDFAVVRCLPNGELDASFGINGVVVTHIGDSEDNASALAIQNDGKIVVAGGSINSNNLYDFALVRYNTDGSLDSKFGINGIVVTGVFNYSASANSLEIQNDGKIVVAGALLRTNFDFVIARYNTDGTLDNTFGADGIVFTQIGTSDDFAFSLKIQKDGKLVVVGRSRKDDGTNDFAIVRYQPDGGLDNLFGQGGKVTTLIGTSSDVAVTVAIQKDGKIVAAGASYNGINNDIALARYNSDGALDNTFGTNGIVITQIGSSSEQANSLIILDEKIIVAGYFDNGNDDDFAIVRYNMDGGLDNTFGTNGIVVTQVGTSNDDAFSLKNQEDGKLIVVGYSRNDDGIYDFAIARYNPDGELDNTFGNLGTAAITPIGISRSEIRSIALQDDGKIISAGYFNNKPNTSPDYDFALARYNQDGELDASFATKGIVTTDIGPTQDYGYSVAIQNDGRIVTGGYSWNGSDYDFALVRYNMDGELDITFGVNGKVISPIGMGNDWAYSIAIQEDGKIVAAGGSHNGTDQDIALARYNTDGTLDNTFDTDGIVVTPIGSTHDYANSLKLQGNGKIVVGGNIALVRYNTDGSLDNTFGQSGVIINPIGNGQVYSVVIQEDGKIVAAGESFQDSRDFTIARYNSDGSLDDTFGADGIVVTTIGESTDIAYSAAIQEDGKIVAAGYSLNQGDYELAIVRYNQSGELDNTFGTDGIITKRVGSSDATAYSIAIQDDGNIIAGGNSEDGEDYSVFLLARYAGDPATGVSEEVMNGIPGDYELVQNYPNPFNPVTKIRYSVPQFSIVTIKVYNVLGKEIETLVKEEKLAGEYELTWNGANLPSGIYFYRIQTESFIETKKMVLLK